MSDPIILLSPEPMELDAPLRTPGDITRHRRLFCKHYDGCLNLSIRHGWQSFSCIRCPLSGAAANQPSPNAFAEERHTEP